MRDLSDYSDEELDQALRQWYKDPVTSLVMKYIKEDLDFNLSNMHEHVKDFGRLSYISGQNNTYHTFLNANSYIKDQVSIDRQILSDKMEEYSNE